MRLIDADKLPVVSSIERIEGKDVFVANWIPGSLIENAPTVDAIPIEWITDWLTKQTIPTTSYGLDCSAIEKMLEDWEKENECRGTDKSN